MSSKTFRYFELRHKQAKDFPPTRTFPVPKSRPKPHTEKRSPSTQSRNVVTTSLFPAQNNLHAGTPQTKQGSRGARPSNGPIFLNGRGHDTMKASAAPFMCRRYKQASIRAPVDIPNLSDSITSWLSGQWYRGYNNKHVYYKRPKDRQVEVAQVVPLICIRQQPCVSNPSSGEDS
jgi:hypothetical protein